VVILEFGHSDISWSHITGSHSIVEDGVVFVKTILTVSLIDGRNHRLVEVKQFSSLAGEQDRRKLVVLDRRCHLGAF